LNQYTAVSKGDIIRNSYNPKMLFKIYLMFGYIYIVKEEDGEL